MNRRAFIQKIGLGATLMVAGNVSLSALETKPEFIKLTILHTNDVHSWIEPFPDNGSRYAGKGGAAKRAALIKKIRGESENILLLDCGDIFQGTPYFNFFNGELEYTLMKKMGYDAATIGNHDFDAGIEGLAEQFPKGGFPLINCNYNFSNTILNGKVLPYKIFNKQGLKIGVLGVGIELRGLVPENMYGETQYFEPIKEANRTAAILKNDLKCDYVICLSHLGYKYKSAKVSDTVLAQNSENIDLILGGHTHTFMKKPDTQLNKKGKQVLINQAGWAGILLGRLDIVFERNRKGRCTTCSNTIIQ